MDGIVTLCPRIPLLEAYPKRPPMNTERGMSAAYSWWVSFTHTTTNNLQGRQQERDMSTVRANGTLSNDTDDLRVLERQP